MNIKFLEELLNSNSPTGHESEGQKIWVDKMLPISDEVKMSAYGNAICVLKSKKDNPKKVLIEAHIDEISWMVTDIESNGLIRVKPNGGSDSSIASSKTVDVISFDGKIYKGVFGSPAIHVKEYDEPSPKSKDLYVDLGLDSKEEVEKLNLGVGCMVIFDDKYQKIGNYHTGRALDNRLGSFIIYEVANKIKENKIELDFDLYVANCVQEEVGLFGAKMLANSGEKFDLVIVHDVTHITKSPKYDISKLGNVEGGKGTCLEHTSQNHVGVLNFIKEVAKSKDIKYQNTIGSYGNDTSAFFLANGGTPTVIISTPIKYMHTTVEMAHEDDILSGISLFYETLTSLTTTNIEDFNGHILK